jgi:hypothetical protein
MFERLRRSLNGRHKKSRLYRGVWMTMAVQNIPFFSLAVLAKRVNSSQKCEFLSVFNTMGT